MKPKYLLWILTGVVAVVAMAAGVAVLVNKFFGDRIAKDRYIECGEGDEIAE